MVGKIASFLQKYQLISVVSFILLGWILWQLRELLLLLFLSYILMVAILPLTKFLEKHHIPKVVGILAILLVVIGSIGFLVAILFQPTVTQTQLLLEKSPDYIKRFNTFTHIRIDVKALQSFIASQTNTISSGAIVIITNTFAVFFTLLSFLIITFYLIMDEEKIQAAFLRFIPKRIRSSARQTLMDVNKTLGNWVRGQLILSFSVGFFSWIVYLFTGLPFALPLAVFAGLMEVVPTIGPVIAFIPAVLLGFTISPLTGLLVTTGYLIVQALEGNLLVPKITQHTVGLHPLAVILAVVIGAKFFGFLGALLFVPLLAVITIIYNRLQKVSL